MRTRGEAGRPGGDNQDERGAVLFILIWFLVIFIAVAAVAVDIAALGARGQDLQNTSDAAALAGVAEYQEVLVETGDPNAALVAAEVVVNQILLQNGLDPAGDRISFELIVSDEGKRLTIRITDNNPDQFLPTDLLGDSIKPGDPEISRQATAEFLACESACNVIVEVPKPFSSVSAVGDGDGYKPILVTNGADDIRLYAINHNSTARNIVCIDTLTQEPCWADGVARTAYAPGVGFNRPNPEMPHTAVVDSTIYWTVTDNNGLRLFCWQTVTDTPCSSAVTLDASLTRPDAGDPDNRLSNRKDENRGGGTFGLGGKVYVFSDNHRIHCFDPSVGAICAGYSPGGNPTGLSVFPANDPGAGNHGSSIDRIIDEDTGYVYATLHIPFAQEAVDCSSPLAEPIGRRVVILNQLTDRYLTSPSIDDVEVTDTGATEGSWWDVEAAGPDLVSFRSVAHGEYLDASPWITTGFDVDDDDRWNTILPGGVGGGGTAYFIENLDVGAGIRDEDGTLIPESPVSSPDAEWNFYPWQCGIDPTLVQAATPDFYTDGTWLHCYNTGAVAGIPGPCAGFQVQGVDAPTGTPSPIHPDGTRFSGRLWFFYGPRVGDGEPLKQGICSSGYERWYDPADLDVTGYDPSEVGINCVRIATGDFDAAMTATMDQVESIIETWTGTRPGAWGDPHWNPAENRLFYPTEHDTPRIICWDFDDNGYCGDITGQADASPLVANNTEDYGFVSDGNCVYGLGHTAFFWAFTADDLGEPCNVKLPPARIERCPCGEDQFKWGELSFEDVNLDVFDEFEVRIVTDDDATDPIFPGDGSFLSIKPGGESASIPLNDLDIPDSATSVLVQFRVSGFDPAAIGEAGTFQLSFVQRPKLVD